MTNQTNNQETSCVVPFGKHKGQSVARMIRDKEYTEWLLKQSWFRQHKIYPVVVAEVNLKYQSTIGVPKVYFVINEQMTRLKIGTSVNPEKRLRSIQTGNADTLVIYGTVLGDRHFEKQLHNELRKHRISGEWFSFPECKLRADEILGKEREIAKGKKYSLWEFRLITGLTEEQIGRAEWLGHKIGIGYYGLRGGWDNPQDITNPLRDSDDTIRGWVWLRIINSGCLTQNTITPEKA
jgi:hypothetical protein